MRSRKAPAPGKEGAFEVRPLGARALKSLIDTLRPELQEARVLDLFAGQGRFGLEALRHGATHATFVEKDRKLTVEISAALTKARHDGEVLTTDAMKYLARAESGAFAVVFADPPFPLWSPEFAREIFVGAKRLAPVRFVVKYPSRVALPESLGFRLTKEVEFGESILLYYVPA